jgi:hypothetical protein
MARFVVDDRLQMVGARLEQLREAIEAAPKSRRWKLRARIGERRRWYEVPEDPTRKSADERAAI